MKIALAVPSMNMIKQKSTWTVIMRRKQCQERQNIPEIFMRNSDGSVLRMLWNLSSISEQNMWFSLDLPLILVSRVLSYPSLPLVQWLFLRDELSKANPIQKAQKRTLFQTCKISVLDPKPDSVKGDKTHMYTQRRISLYGLSKETPPRKPRAQLPIPEKRNVSVRVHVHEARYEGK